MIIPLAAGLISFLFFLLFQTYGIYTGDSGDLVTAAYLGGIPHPPGYPLYTFLGFVASKMPIATVSWRIGLLSSIPHAVAVALTVHLIYRLTKLRVAAVFGACMLVGNYLFFLYSITPEVFALLDLFVVLCLYIAMRYREENAQKYLWYVSFVMGLALSHHHFIVFLAPGLGYLLYVKRKTFTRQLAIRCVFFFLLGLLPYIYIPIAARGDAIINWDKPVDMPHFIRLVTRADYGTFISSGFYGVTNSARIIQLKAYGRFFFIDFGWIGLALGILGFTWMWRRFRMWAVGMLIGFLFLGPIFFFYASFPLVNRFTLGTYERFLLPSYLIVIIFVSCGLAAIISWIQKYLHRSRQWVVMSIIVIFFLYPISNIGITFWRFWGIRNDRTADRLGQDILLSVPQNGILLLQRDTPLFVSQYVRYALGERRDVALLHTSRFFTDDYPDVIAKAFPYLAIPDTRGEEFTNSFLVANVQTHPIASIAQLPAPVGWYWVPHGLVYLLTPEAQLPQPVSMLESNKAIWAQYQDPNGGILSRYNHLMLADVRNVYATARFELGKTLLKAELFKDAREQFNIAIHMGADIAYFDVYMHLGLAELFLNNCEEALRAFENARTLSTTTEPLLTFYEASTYRDCLGDEQRARALFDEYEKLQKSLETPLVPR